MSVHVSSPGQMIAIVFRRREFLLEIRDWFAVLYEYYVHFFFFFQAEDGIRDYKVTGVQTCALPICESALIRSSNARARSWSWEGTSTDTSGPLICWQTNGLTRVTELSTPSRAAAEDRKSVV